MLRKPFPPNESPSNCSYALELLHALRYIPNLENGSSSIKTTVHKFELWSKNRPRTTKNVELNRAPRFPATDITLRGKLDKSSIPALRVMWSILKLRGSAAPAPKNRPDHGRRAPRTRKSSHFERLANHSFLWTCTPAEVTFIIYARGWAFACT